MVQVDDKVLLQRLFHVFLSSNLSMIVASIDGRGTGFRGDKWVLHLYCDFPFFPNLSVTYFKNSFKFTVYRDLGRYETIDQLRAGK